MNRVRAVTTLVAAPRRQRVTSAASDDNDSSSDSASESTSDAARVRIVATENDARRGNQQRTKSATATAAATKQSTARMSTAKPRAAAAAMATHEMKRAVEKKFRTRYRSLQEAYESRLHALAVQLQHAVAQIQTDTTVFCLQENPLTSEFADMRLGEIVHECFFGERERYIQVVSDQVAWQASDLRELRRKLRTVQQREKDALGVCLQREQDCERLQRQLETRERELEGQKRLTVQREDELLRLRDDTVALERKLDAAALDQRAFDALQRECETLKQQQQHESDKHERIREQQTSLLREIDALKAANVVRHIVSCKCIFCTCICIMTRLKLIALSPGCTLLQKLEMAKHVSEQEIAHVQHLLSLADAKSRDLSDALRQHERKDYPSTVARLEAELAHLEQATAVLQTEHQALETKYADFGAHVDAFMKEQASEKAAARERSDARVQLVEAQVERVRQQGLDAVQAKELEIARLVDQVQFRQDALAKAEQTIATLETRLQTVETHVTDEKRTRASHVSKLEREIAQCKQQVEREQARAIAAEKCVVDTKDAYERKLSALRESHDQQLRERRHAQDAEAQTRWQNDLAAKHEARIEALKAKYDAALEKQQTELLRARQQALDAAAAITAKYDATQRAQRADDELEKKRRAEAAARERAARDDERARELAHARMQSEFDEREKRLAERERLLLEKERAVERQRVQAAQQQAAAASNAAATAAATPATPALTAPSVVVLNMAAADDASDQEPRASRKSASTGTRSAAVTVVRRSAASRRTSDAVDDASADVISTAELQAREAQLALESETRLQKALEELQSRKEKEFRAAMVNVRRGIQKLEVAADDARKDKAQLELVIAREREAFVALKTELDASKEAKQTVVQRLEEANDNIGKLRRVVSELETKRQRTHEQLVKAQTKQSASAAAASNAQAQLEQVRDALQTLTQRYEQRDTELVAAQAAQAQLESHVSSLERDLERAQREVQATTLAAAEAAKHDVSTASSQYEQQLRVAEVHATELQRSLATADATVERLTRDVQALTQTLATRDATIEQLTTERSQQRKDMSHLARVHKSLAETMERKLADEAAERERVERALSAAEKDVQSTKLHEQRVLLVYKMHLSKLQRNVRELRRGVESDLGASLQHLERDFSVLSDAFASQAAASVRAKVAAVEQQLERERTAWQAQLQASERELSGRFGSERVSEQSKYDAVVQRLDAKTQELATLAAALEAEKRASAALQQTLDTLKRDAERARVEHTALAEQLTCVRAAAVEDATAQEQRHEALEQRTRMCNALLVFVRSLDSQRASSASVADVHSLASGGEQELAAELECVAASLNKAQQRAIAEARADGAASVQSELEAAKRTLQSVCAKVQSNDDDDEMLQQHLPWYVAAVRAVKRLQDDTTRRCDALQRELSARDAQVTELQQRSTELHEATNVLRFEKETLARELSMLTQTSAKKREQDLHELRLECERKIEQAKHTHGTDRMKAEQEYQVRQGVHGSEPLDGQTD